tara:strand:+ start:802 stop:951 length:150 start_codon:yes stop_codon:yes gene_type:complete
MKLPDGPAKREKVDPFTTADYGDGTTAAPSVAAKMVDPAVFKMADERDY